MTWNTIRAQKVRTMASVLVPLSMSVLIASTGSAAAQDLIELPAENRPLSSEFEEVYRLGSVDGDGWDTFGHIAGVDFDAAGNLYILDTQAVRMYVVDQQANLVRQFIEEGEGPGEFGRSTSAAMKFEVMRDGRVVVYDPGQLGFTLFYADGGFERTIPFRDTQMDYMLIGGLQAFPEMNRVLSTTGGQFPCSCGSPDQKTKHRNPRSGMS